MCVDHFAFQQFSTGVREGRELLAGFPQRDEVRFQPLVRTSHGTQKCVVVVDTGAALDDVRAASAGVKTASRCS